MPGPLSRTATRAAAVLRVDSTLTRTVPPSGVNLSAFESRLATAFSSCGGSAKTSTGSAGWWISNVIALRSASASERLRDGLDEGAEVERAGAERGPPGFEAGHVEDLVDEVEHAAGVAAREVHLLRHRRVERAVEPGLHVVERAERERERGPELVADVREEPAAGVVELAELVGLEVLHLHAVP